VTYRTLFDATTVASLLGDGADGSFLRLCDPSGACVTQSRFMSLILASAELVGAPFAAGSYLSVMVGTYGTYFEVYLDAASGTYSDVRLVYQNFAQIVGAQQPPALGTQCALPPLVGLSRTAFSGWSTSVFHVQRYAAGYITTCVAPSPPAPPSPPPSPLPLRPRGTSPPPLSPSRPSPSSPSIPTPWAACTSKQLGGDIDENGFSTLGDAVYVAVARLQYGSTQVNPIKCMAGDFDSDGTFTVNDAAFVAMAQFGIERYPWDKVAVSSPSVNRRE
jgi:hypothetical protein